MLGLRASDCVLNSREQELTPGMRKPDALQHAQPGIVLHSLAADPQRSAAKFLLECARKNEGRRIVGWSGSMRCDLGNSMVGLSGDRSGRAATHAL